MAGPRNPLSGGERLVIRDAMARTVIAFKHRTGKGSAGAIADATDTAEETVRSYLGGRRRPSVSFVHDFAQKAGVPVLDLHVALGWIPAEETLSPDPSNIAESIAAVAASVGRLEPHVHRLLNKPDVTLPAPLAAAAAIFADLDGAARFDVRLFTVVSGRRYRGVTNGAAEFILRPGNAPLPDAEVELLARQAGMPWRPRPAAGLAHPDYWRLNLELRARTYRVLQDADLGQHTWQGEPGTRTWITEASAQPAHILVQDPFGGVSRPGRTGGYTTPVPRTLIVVGARYSAGLAAAAVAESLGWQFVPVRSDVEFTADGRMFPVARDRLTGRVLAWSSVARQIQDRYREGDPWRAVVLLRPSALRNQTQIDRYALDLLRDTPADVVYVRPPDTFLSWWADRQTGAAQPGEFAGSTWIAHTNEELRSVENVMADRGRRSDLCLALPSTGCLPAAGAAIPEAVMDAHAHIAGTILGWLDETANQGRPSLRTQILPGILSSWLPTLALDPDARLERMAAAVTRAAG